MKSWIFHGRISIRKTLWKNNLALNQYKQLILWECDFELKKYISTSTTTLQLKQTNSINTDYLNFDFFYRNNLKTFVESEN